MGLEGGSRGSVVGSRRTVLGINKHSSTGAQAEAPRTVYLVKAASGGSGSGPIIIWTNLSQFGNSGCEADSVGLLVPQPSQCTQVGDGQIHGAVCSSRHL